MKAFWQPAGITSVAYAFYRLALIGFSAAVLIGSTSSTAAPDCSNDAKSSFEQGVEAMSERRYAKAESHFDRASESCDHAAYWQALGEARQAQSSEQSELQQSALEAYGKAFSSARLARDDKAGARAARSIAELGLRSGDPLKSQNWLVVASRLDPDHPDLLALQDELDEARGQLSTSEIDTGLSQTRGIGTVNSLLGGKVSSNAFWDPEDESSGGAGYESASVSGSINTSSSNEAMANREEVSIDIPIRFDSNSTAATAATAENVRNLAAVLSNSAETSRIILTGHADTRGEADYNQSLSLARAAAVRELLVAAQPVLEGRIDTFGAGESRPLDPGTSERAHANNRRLEVTVVQLAN
ncbi:MAG: hypothetical protein Cons2KO_27970 [Congregibacter sp.]